VIAPLVVVLATTAACGSKKKNDGVASLSSGKASSSASAKSSPMSQADMEKAALKYAQCMRQHGINMPDPKAGKMSMQMKKGDESKMAAAQKACQSLLPNGGQGPGTADPKMRDQQLKFAQCMRQQGINMPDPGSDGSLKLDGRGVPPAKMQAAQKACAKYQPGQMLTQNGGGGSDNGPGNAGVGAGK
jgi:hypothetical protein